MDMCKSMCNPNAIKFVSHVRGRIGVPLSLSLFPAPSNPWVLSRTSSCRPIYNSWLVNCISCLRNSPFCEDMATFCHGLHLFLFLIQLLLSFEQRLHGILKSQGKSRANSSPQMFVAVSDDWDSHFMCLCSPAKIKNSQHTGSMP